MIKVIKSQSEGTFSYTRRKGNFLVGESTVNYGPTSSTGFYSGIEPPEGGYTLYIDKESNGPSIYVFTGGTELLNFCNNNFNAQQTTIFGVIDWINQESDKFVDPNYFEFTVKTDNSGVSTSTQFKLPLISSDSINFTIDWGDGNSDVITTYNQNETTHTYSSAGTYTIKIAGIIKGFRFAGGGDRLKFLEIKNWGCLNINTSATFQSCNNMTCTAVDSPRITSTNMDYTFFQCYQFNGNISNWDVSNVTRMEAMLRHLFYFDQPIGIWDMSKVTTMWTMLQQTYTFDQDLSGWDTGNVTVMHGVFAASKFNKDISMWNTSKVTAVSYMFSKDWYQQYNNPVGNWDISNLTSAPVFINTNSFSTANYDDLLIKWAAKPKKNNVGLFVTAKYSSSAAASRAILVNNHGWTISDYGPL